MRKNFLFITSLLTVLGIAAPQAISAEINSDHCADVLLAGVYNKAQSTNLEQFRAAVLKTLQESKGDDSSSTQSSGGGGGISYAGIGLNASASNSTEQKRKIVSDIQQGHQSNITNDQLVTLYTETVNQGSIDSWLKCMALHTGTVPGITLEALGDESADFAVTLKWTPSDGASLSADVEQVLWIGVEPLQPEELTPGATIKAYQGISQKVRRTSVGKGTIVVTLANRPPVTLPLDAVSQAPSAKELAKELALSVMGSTDVDIPTSKDTSKMMDFQQVRQSYLAFLGTYAELEKLRNSPDSDEYADVVSRLKMDQASAQRRMDPFKTQLLAMDAALGNARRCLISVMKAPEFPSNQEDYVDKLIRETSIDEENYKLYVAMMTSTDPTKLNLQKADVRMDVSLKLLNTIGAYLAKFKPAP